MQVSPIEVSRRGGETCSLSDENLLLSGTVLKNTGEAVGVCVYRSGLKKWHPGCVNFSGKLMQKQEQTSPNLGPTF